MQIIDLLVTGILLSFLTAAASAFMCKERYSLMFLAVWAFSFVVLAVAHFFEPAFYVYHIVLSYYYVRLGAATMMDLIKMFAYKSNE